MLKVRHLSRDTLKNVAETIYKISPELCKRILFDNLLKFSSISLQSIVILSVSQVLPTNFILKVMNGGLGFQYELLNRLSENKTTNHNLTNCYKALSKKSLTEFEFSEWCREILEPGLKALQSFPIGTDENLCVELLLNDLVKLDNRVTEAILKNRKELNVGFVLSCLSTSKKKGYCDKMVSTHEMWKGLISFEEIKDAMIHSEDNVRSSALMLIIETKKITENFNPRELDVLEFFFKYNINVQSPSMRQNILGMLKNLFVRIQAIIQAAVRKSYQPTIDFYYEYLMKLQEFCLDNLFDGANFTRRTLSLRMLFYIMEVVNQLLEDKACGFWNQRKFDVLINVLHDSFEANKEMTIEIMKFIPKNVIKKLSTVTLKDLQKLSSSIKPPESLTAAYLLEFMVNISEPDLQTLPSTYPEAYDLMIWCEKQLLSALEIAEQSLIVASSKNPLYGLVLCIRHSLSKLDIKLLGGDYLWIEFFERLLRMCKRLTDVVGPVVNNASPEGILPKEYIKDDWIKIVESTTPQMILLCSWRTIKEVSLLLGDLCLRGCLKVDQFLTVGDHFLELLAQIKHRGAFEQCFFGFSKLCLRLWNCDEPELHKLPSSMLNQMIESISGRNKKNNDLLTMKNLCSTRRSAGLPFMIQALVTTEFNLKASTKDNFHYVMKNLLCFARTSEHLETRTHSLNILRALYRCSDLNEPIGEYIAEGIKCAVLGYGAESWIERNSSTLLFSALMVRIFGVQRTKDNENLNVRNRMTGRIFFLRYPELYDFFMEQLEEAAAFVQTIKLNGKLHPLLLLLNRLYSSALEGSESNLTLTGFLPVVAKCSGCIEMSTRILCAKFIANVLPPDLLVNRIKKSIQILEEGSPANVTHGILLQVCYLVKKATQGSESLIEILDQLTPFALKLKKQMINFSTCLDIVIEIIKKIWDLKPHAQKLSEIIGLYANFSSTGYFGLSMITKKLFILNAIKSKLEKSEQTSSDMDLDMDFTRNGTPQTLILHLMFNYELITRDPNYAFSMQDDYDITDSETYFFKPNSKEICRVKNPEKFKLFSKYIKPNVIKDNAIMTKAYDILSYYDDKADQKLDHFQYLIDISLNKPEQLKNSMLKFAYQQIRIAGYEMQLDYSFLEILSIDSSVFVK